MADGIEEEDVALMERLLALKADKENRLRRQLAVKQHEREELEEEAVRLHKKRHDLVMHQATQALPEEALTQEAFITYKLNRAKDYKLERVLALQLVNLKSDAEVLEQAINQVQKDIQQVTKSQEKLKEILV